MKRPYYITVQEMRKHPEWLPKEDTSRGGTRFEGTTTPSVAFKHFKNKDGKVLECGPYTGSFTKVMKDAGYKHIYGADVFDGRMKEYVNEKSYDEFKMVDFNIEDIPWGDKTFDYATAWGIGEHQENTYFFMREIHRVLKDDGIFIYALPNVFHIMSRLLFLKQGNFPRWVRNNHIMVMPKAVFSNTFLRYFYLEEVIYTKPGIQYLFFSIFNKFLPANEWFGNYVVYVLRKKPGIYTRGRD